MAIVDQIAATANAAGVDPQLAIAVAREESGLNPNPPDGLKGEIGIFQLLPSSFPRYTPQQLRDPQTNINVGVGYLAQLLADFGDPVAAVAAYNWGPTNVSAAIAQGSGFSISAAPGDPFVPGWWSAVPASTRAYAQRVFGGQLPFAPAPGGGGMPPDVSYAGIVPGGAPQSSQLTTVLVLAAVGLLLLWAGSEAAG